MLTDILSPAKRKLLYEVLAVIGGLLTLTQVYFIASGTDQPAWLTGALAVFAAVAGLAHKLAGANVTQ